MIRGTRYRTKHNGKDVELSVRPLKRKHAQAVEAAVNLGKLTADKTPEQLSADPEVIRATNDMLDRSRDAIIDCASDIWIDGDNIKAEEIADEMVYTTLALDIMSKLVQMSFLSEEEAKNSQGQHSTMQTGAEATTPFVE